MFEGEALLRRMYKYGLLDDNQNKLDYVLALTPQDFLERRLQTLVFKLGLAKSMHHARVLIRQRHIRCSLVGDASHHTSAKMCVICSRVILTVMSCIPRVGKQIVNVPSFIVRVDSQKHIDFALNSPFGGGRPGRVKRKNATK